MRKLCTSSAISGVLVGGDREAIALTPSAMIVEGIVKIVLVDRLGREPTVLVLERVVVVGLRFTHRARGGFG